jgi:hypothetical protein
MPFEYILPTDVTSPKRQWTLLSVVYDGGEGEAAVAMGLWEGKAVLAMRWNGDENSSIGNPQSRGLPTWFIIPDEFRESVAARVYDLSPEKRTLLKEFLMNAKVLTNTIALPDVRQAVQEAVLRGMGTHSSRTPWTVKLFASQDRVGYFVRIEAPNGYLWERHFEGPEEQAPPFIEKAIRQANLLRGAGEYGAKKLPEYENVSLSDREAMILTQVHRM